MEAFLAGTRLSTTRQTIARRMRESLASTAQYTLHGSAHAGGLLAARARSKCRRSLTTYLTIFRSIDLVTFCLIRALKDNAGAQCAS